MRQFLFGVLLVIAAAGQGAASSFLTLSAESPAKSPSVVVLGEPAAPAIEAQPLASASGGAEIFAISASVVAFGADAIPAAREEVASIGDAGAREKPRWTAESMPFIIRGGVIGDAFSAPSAPEVMPGEAVAASAPPETPRPERAPARPDPAPVPAQNPPAPTFRAPR